ncbi:MAG: metallophosphoesterase [Ignavibacteriae bacterium]|nr:metallophosphoesterase [Ignavibacteriota bacterium]
MKFSILIKIIMLTIFFLNCENNEKYKTIKIGMCSDVHLPTMHDSERRITKFIDSMKIAEPDFIIELVDFVIQKEEYQHMFEIWKSYPGKKYHVIGNHEMDGGTTLAKALEYREMNNSFYSFSQDGFKFIVLDCNDKKDPNQKGYSSYIGKNQIRWLKEELQKSTDPIIIFSHQGIGSDPNNPGERYSIENADSVREILEKHNSENQKGKIICCFNGHTHHDYAEEINGIWYITINSMAYKWLGEEYEYRRYSEEVDKNFKWIKYTAPYKDPLFTVVEISTEGYIKISGKKSEYVGPSPWELGYPEHLKKYVRPEITERLLKFMFN